MVQDSEEQLSATIDNIENLNILKTELLEDRKYIETALALLKDGGIKTKIIKQYIPIINKLVNKYLAQMGFFVNFNIDENFNEVIKSRYRDEFSYANFSEGEKTRIDLALMFTWRTIAKMKNSVNTNLLILDEILDGSLDANGTDEFLKIIQTLTDDTNTFIISHKQDQLIDKFDKVYRFEKIRNFSRLV
jgi:DNA repair exonuclease SbcCD ATPase subunit